MGIQPTASKPQPLRLLTLVLLAILHAGCLFAPFYFTWNALIVTGVLWFVSLCFGISIGWHRLITHASFKTYRPIKYFFAFCGALAMQGSLFRWVGIHRLHHRHSDSDGDPHSPREGLWWSHIAWGFRRNELSEKAQRCIADISEDTVLKVIDRFGLPLCFSFAFLLFAIGGAPWVVWGMCVRLVLCFHATLLVNSAGHKWGYRNFTTGDDSRNNWFVAMLTFGEGWHNNHHAQQRSAAHGMRWFEIDISYFIISCLRAVRLAWDVVVPRLTKESKPAPVARSLSRS